jgi:hypothetical protein
MTPPKSLAECLASVDTPAGRQRLQMVLANRPYPHFSPVPGNPDLLERLDADGVRTVGRFVNRRFLASSSESRTD